ncbi:hypothetical protein F0562_029668 [Nyssa sinensis]|uniref:Uncharacterized protein n=1 Tax=Nyssa sinensis TaxID=561372 RepID=A0A5J5B3N8_9ASTE|nr:hypothetical protein F0562_029668 [Nyssa sinensis]
MARRVLGVSPGTNPCGPSPKRTISCHRGPGRYNGEGKLIPHRLGKGKRGTVMIDNNTWNINHLATIGRAMSSYEDELCEIMKTLDVDWSMIAKASPCYVTYLKDSMDQIINCFESNVDVSQIIALETTAAVQMRIDEAKQTIQ